MSAYISVTFRSHDLVAVLGYDIAYISIVLINTPIVPEMMFLSHRRYYKLELPLNSNMLLSRGC
jgi:hypothetical protein